MKRASKACGDSQDQKSPGAISISVESANEQFVDKFESPPPQKKKFKVGQNF